MENKILAFGIVAIALAAATAFCSWGGLATGIVAIVFAVLTSKQVKAYEAQGGVVAGKVKVGKILAKIALPLAIVALVAAVVIAIVSCACAAAANALTSAELGNAIGNSAEGIFNDAMGELSDGLNSIGQ